MVRGIEKFKEYFSEYTGQYAFIGGAACDILLGNLGEDFRATKDLDIVLIMEMLNDDQELITSYYPITVAPFQKNKLYTELAPYPALRPYIRCFWGTTDIVTCDESTSPKESLVIPDTCMDIIIRFDHVHDISNAFSMIIWEHHQKAFLL